MKFSNYADLETRESENALGRIIQEKTNENQTIETSKQAANKRKTTLPFLNGVFKPVKHQNFGTLRNARNIGKGNGTKGRRRPKK